MITSQVTNQQIAEWKRLWERHRKDLHPGSRSGEELLRYLQGRYQLMES